jgi:hypothetical protein
LYDADDEDDDDDDGYLGKNNDKDNYNDDNDDDDDEEIAIKKINSCVSFKFQILKLCFLTWKHSELMVLNITFECG